MSNASFVGRTRLAGNVNLCTIHNICGNIPPNLSLKEIYEYAFPHNKIPKDVYDYRRKNLTNIFRGLKKIIAARLLNVAHFYGRLGLTIISNDGRMIPLGIVSFRVVTTAGVNFIATRLNDGATTIGNFDFHGFGTGVVAEAVGDVGLGTELTTQYATDNTRPTGTPSNPSANVYQSVGTVSPDTGGTIAITEHGLFSASSGVTLLDRTVFSAVNLVAGSDSLQATYQLTVSAGG